LKKVLIICNPVAGSGTAQKIDRAAALLRSWGCRLDIVLTSKRGDAEVLARQVRTREDLLVVAAGGDGTYNEVANGLSASAVPMAILPLGTTSVLAHEIGLSTRIDDALFLAVHGEPEVIHLGKITLSSPAAGSEAGRPTDTYVSHHFLLMAGIGFDGETVRRVSQRMKRIAGKGAYVISGIRECLNYQPNSLAFTVTPPYEIKKLPRTSVLSHSDPASALTLTGYGAVVGKASCYGGDFKVTPDARLTDPSLYLMVTHGNRRVDILRYAVGILAGRHLAFGDITYIKAESVAIEGSAHVQIDGDYAGTTPAQIEVVPDALRLVMRLRR
jgi:diacylglycerol kinase (ATP)